jgi:hypothetical protein
MSELHFLPAAGATDWSEGRSKHLENNRVLSDLVACRQATEGVSDRSRGRFAITYGS